MKMKQFDVKAAFLNGELEETIYMHQPEGFELDSSKVCELKKSLYGLKQSARCWNQKFVICLKAFNLQPTEADPCVFVSNDNNEQLILVIYVDDGAIASTSLKRIEELLQYLEKNLEITTGDLKMFLGIEIEYLSDGSILAHQQQYIKKVIQRFRGEIGNPVRIPADSYTNLTHFDKEEGRKAGNVPYREAIGSLMFLAMVTRPDIAFIVGALSRYTEDPRRAHWNGIRRIIKYLKGTVDYGLIYNSESECSKLSVFSDADFAGDEITRRSTSGYAIKLGKNLISWGSRRQSTVALSTTESEYIAPCAAVQEMVWAKRLVEGLVGKIIEKPELYVDNQSAIKLIQNPQYHCRTKHIDIKYKFVREKYQRKFFNLEYINTKDQQADIFTKPLDNAKFESFRNKINVTNAKIL